MFSFFLRFRGFEGDFKARAKPGTHQTQVELLSERDRAFSMSSRSNKTLCLMVGHFGQLVGWSTDIGSLLDHLNLPPDQEALLLKKSEIIIVL